MAAFTFDIGDEATTVTCDACGQATTGDNPAALAEYAAAHTCPDPVEDIPEPERQHRIANPADPDDDITDSVGNVITDTSSLPGTAIRLRRPNQMGRTPRWSDPKLLDRIVDAIAGGSYMTTAAEANGVPKATLFRWLQEAQADNADPRLRDFHDRVSRARALAEDTAVAFLWDVAKGGHLTKRSTKHDSQGDGYVIEEQFTPPDAKPVMFLLERSFPDRWSRRSTLDVGVNPDGPAQSARGGEDERFASLAERAAAALAMVRGEVVASAEGEPQAPAEAEESA